MYAPLRETQVATLEKARAKFGKNWRAAVRRHWAGCRKWTLEDVLTRDERDELRRLKLSHGGRWLDRYRFSDGRRS
jgi:hypothetical protein